MLELFKTIDLEQFDFGDPLQARQALGLVQNRIKRGFNETDDRLRSSSGITVNVGGQQGALDDILEAGLMPVGSIMILYVSWGAAMNRKQFGWEPCDGDNGTPPWIPKAKSSNPQRFFRAVTEGADPWTGWSRQAKTGGGGTHTHALGLNDHDVAFQAHDDHTALGDHVVSKSCIDVCNSGGATSVLTDVTLDSHDAINAHTAHQIDAGNTDLTHSSDSCAGTAPVPPYCEGIPMMRVR